MCFSAPNNIREMIFAKSVQLTFEVERNFSRFFGNIQMSTG